MSKYIAGIDFGTSNSTAAIIDETGVAKMIALEDEHFTMPSAMFFDAESNEVFYGRAAEKQNATYPTSGRMMRALKSILGTGLMYETTPVNGKYTSYLNIIRDFLFEIKLSLDMTAGAVIDTVVLGRPIHFTSPANDEQDALAESALRAIAANLGFKNIAFQYEPLAAAFAYERQLSPTQEKLALIVDIGGGTSDFSVVRLSGARKDDLDRKNDILANTGIRIGGKDFDEHLSKDAFMPLFGRGGQYNDNGTIKPIMTTPYDNLSSWNKISELYTPKTLNLVDSYINKECEPRCLHRLREVITNRLGHTHLSFVEQTKINLSSCATIDLVLDYISDKPNTTITRQDFENYISKDVKKIQTTIMQCVNDANIFTHDIEQVVLTGGSSQIPCIINMVRSLFPSAEISSADTMTSVGMGLAYDAFRRNKSNSWN